MPNKKPKDITKTKLKKELQQLSQEELATLLMNLSERSEAVKRSLSSYFLGQEYRSDLEAYYSDKLYKVFNPSESKLMTSGVDISRAKELIKDYEASVFTGDKSLDDFYKAKVWLDLTTYALDFLDTYGDGPEELYDLISDYFSRLCRYISDGQKSGDDNAIAFSDDHSEDMEKLVSLADPCGYGLGDELSQLWSETSVVINSETVEV